MRHAIKLAIVLVALAAGLGCLAPAALADEGSLLTARDVLGSCRDRYARARTLQATFEHRQLVGARETYTGLMLYRSPDAYRTELKLSVGTLVTLREDTRLRRWLVTNSDIVPKVDRTVSGAVQPPFPPSFDAYDMGTAAMLGTSEEGKKLTYAVEVKFNKSKDYTYARLWIESGTWIVRRVELLDAKRALMTEVRFSDVRLDGPLPEGFLSPPKTR